MIGLNTEDARKLTDSQIIITDSYIFGSLQLKGSFIETVGTWRKMAALSQNQSSRKSLIIQVPEGEFPLTELYDFGKCFSELGFASGTRIAVVCSPCMFSTMKFLADVITNRHCHEIRVFRKTDSARRWLLDDP